MTHPTPPFEDDWEDEDNSTTQAELRRDGLWRRVFKDAVHWVPDYLYRYKGKWQYAVVRFAFVPGYHLCYLYDEDDLDSRSEWVESIMQSFTTLHEAMDVCRVLLANGGVTPHT